MCSNGEQGNKATHPAARSTQRLRWVCRSRAQLRGAPAHTHAQWRAHGQARWSEAHRAGGEWCYLCGPQAGNDGTIPPQPVGRGIHERHCRYQCFLTANRLPPSPSVQSLAPYPLTVDWICVKNYGKPLFLTADLTFVPGICSNPSENNAERAIMGFRPVQITSHTSSIAPLFKMVPKSDSIIKRFNDVSFLIGVSGPSRAVPRSLTSART